jgi:methylaspartate mutase sigma subunit
LAATEGGGSIMESEKGSAGKVVIGVIGEDVHVVGIRILEHALKNSGFSVISLGAQVSQEEFINAAIETNADAIFISSFSGHAELLTQSFRDKCMESGLANIIMYIGGNLVLAEKPWQEVESMFKNLGFNRIYPPGSSSTQAIEDLKNDLSLIRR